MRNKNFIKKLVGLGLVAALTLSSVACGKTVDNTTEADKDTSGGVKKVKVAWQSNSFPLAYEDDNGNLTGYEIEVLKLVDEQLTDYEFEYELAGGQDAQYAGLSSGKYDLVLSNAFYTKERDEAYSLPKNPLGASLVGIIVPKGTEGVQDFESAAKAGIKLAPILAGDGLYYVVYKYNEENPDNQIKLEATDNADSFMNAISWVADGRYDFAVWPKNYYEQLVVADGGDLHEYNDKLDFYDCRSVYTYPIISKDKPEVAEAISEVLGTLKDDGTLSELSQKFYGYDAFMYDTVKND
ncbi:MAG: transporter substrate-binding domain-containing protein [Eubacterium sp.]|nr:transporter substrate-binding domain-containing protein [Eubacterium sp.]